jgi:hypothetical protein
MRENSSRDAGAEESGWRKYVPAPVMPVVQLPCLLELSISFRIREYFRTRMVKYVP